MNKTVRTALNQLRRQHKVAVYLNKVTPGDITDYHAGVQNVTEATPVRIHAILLPAEYAVREQLDRGASSRYAGDIYVGDRELIVRAKDNVEVGDWIDYASKRWDVIDIAHFEGDAYFALIRNLQNESSS